MTKSLLGCKATTQTSKNEQAVNEEIRHSDGNMLNINSEEMNGQGGGRGGQHKMQGRVENLEIISIPSKWPEALKPS